MKRCPTCNQQFTDEWLTFCTQDGTSLVDMPVSPDEPPPTVAYASMPPSVSPSEQPTLDYPGAYKPPAVQMASPQPMQAGWNPPPPPAYASQPQKSLAVLSMVLGIVSMTIGWCCYFGVLTSPIAIGLGIFSLFQMKKDPTKYGGKGMAIAGIVTGALYFVLIFLIILIYGLGALMNSVS
ncbi:MAG TPA: DUF4190 domain-containing protein [Pyrinomonadaceae bacterium]|nr:DUF4190 domain-containing protein [Pyrinomonadaceae bacterium]